VGEEWSSERCILSGINCTSEFLCQFQKRHLAEVGLRCPSQCMPCGTSLPDVLMSGRLSSAERHVAFSEVEKCLSQACQQAGRRWCSRRRRHLRPTEPRGVSQPLQDAVPRCTYTLLTVTLLHLLLHLNMNSH